MLKSKDLKSKAATYDESSIEVLEGLEAVRKKPSMYIGNLEDGAFHILKEVLDNALDEAMNGFSNKVICDISNVDYIEVVDEGRGIPVGINQTYNKSTLEIVMTKLHAGGKISSDNASYKVSSGTHGVGVSCTNALSSYFEVFTFREGKWYAQEYNCGIPLGPVSKRKPEGKYANKGTIVRFKPDSTIIKNNINEEKLITWFRNSSFLNPKIEFILIDSNKETHKFYSENGLADYITYITEESNTNPLASAFIISSENCDIALQWFESDNTIINSWCNASPTSEGGTHVVALTNLIDYAFRQYREPKKFASLKSQDLRVGLYAAINIKVPSPQFDSQTKEKLINTDVTKIVKECVGDKFDKYLKDNKKLVNTILDRALVMRKAFDKFALDKKALSSLKSRGKAQLPPANKFAKSTCSNAEDRELFIVEGLSAGGTAKAARDTKYQEILMLKGKIMNIAKQTDKSIYASDDILNILKAIGFDPITKEHQIRVGKVIILTDADVDGCHISMLLLVLFQRLYPELIKDGKVFIVDAPLFIGKTKTSELYAESLEALKSLAERQNKKLETITRAKGWGEINASLLKELAFDKSSRKLCKINPVTTKEDLDYFYSIVGDDVTVRKQILSEI